MNIFGRVFGGLLVLISLGWLASIAGVRPGWLGSNQINSETPMGTSNLAAPAKSNETGVTPATGSKATVSKFDTGTQKTTTGTTTGTTTAGAKTGTPEVEANPRAADNSTTGTGTKAVGNTVPGATPSPTPAPTTVAAPVSAGW
jgi:hypothetical protein